MRDASANDNEHPMDEATELMRADLAKEMRLATNELADDEDDAAEDVVRALAERLIDYVVARDGVGARTLTEHGAGLFYLALGDMDAARAFDPAAHVRRLVFFSAARCIDTGFAGTRATAYLAPDQRPAVLAVVDVLVGETAGVRGFAVHADGAVARTSWSETVPNFTEAYVVARRVLALDEAERAALEQRAVAAAVRAGRDAGVLCSGERCLYYCEVSGDDAAMRVERIDARQYAEHAATSPAELHAKWLAHDPARTILVWLNVVPAHENIFMVVAAPTR